MWRCVTGHLYSYHTPGRNAGSPIRWWQATLRFTKAKKVGGDASTPVIRGKKRYLFDLNITVTWEVRCIRNGVVSQPSKVCLWQVEFTGSKNLKGEVACGDFSTDCEGEYECSAKITTKNVAEFSDECQRAAREQAKAALGTVLQAFVTEYESK